MKNSEKIIKALNSITDKDIERMASELEQQIEQERKELIEFEKSGKLNLIINNIII